MGVLFKSKELFLHIFFHDPAFSILTSQGITDMVPLPVLIITNFTK